MKVKSVKFVGIQPVYNMTVDEFHNYVIFGGVVLKNCDALRYFSITRTLRPEILAAEQEDWGEGVTDYDDEMTGGDMSDSYISYGGN